MGKSSNYAVKQVRSDLRQRIDSRMLQHESNDPVRPNYREIRPESESDLS